MPPPFWNRSLLQLLLISCATPTSLEPLVLKAEPPPGPPVPYTAVNSLSTRPEETYVTEVEEALRRGDAFMGFRAGPGYKKIISSEDVDMAQKELFCLRRKHPELLSALRATSKMDSVGKCMRARGESEWLCVLGRHCRGALRGV